LKGSVSGIIAPNKSGKSAFIDILIYTLFNELPRGDRADILNHTYRDAGGAPCHSFSCSAELDIDGKPARIMKKVEKSGHPRVSFNYNGEELTGSSSLETYKTITQYIGTYKDSINTIICLQAGTSPKTASDDFVHMTNDQRKSTLGRLFNLNIFAELAKDAKEEKLRLKYEAIEKEKAINIVKRGISVEELKNITSKKDNMENNLIYNIKKNIADFDVELSNILDVWRDTSPVVVNEIVDVLTIEELNELVKLESIELPKTYQSIYDEIVKNVILKPEKPLPTMPNNIYNIVDANVNFTLQKLKIFNNPPIKAPMYTYEQIRQLLLSNNINGDPNSLYYKDITSNLQYDEVLYTTLVSNNVNTIHHNTMINAINTMQDNEFLPPNIRQLIQEYMKTYQLYASTNTEMELVRNINIESFGLIPTCTGCNKIRQIANAATQKIETIKNCIEKNKDILIKLNDFKQFLEKQLADVAVLAQLHKVYAANILVGYQNNLMSYLMDLDTIDHYNKYNIYIDAINQIEKCKSDDEKTKKVIEDRRNFLRTKASTRRQYLEFNLIQMRTNYLLFERQLGELKASETIMTERLKQIEAMETDLFNVKSNEALYELYQTIIDDKKGIPALLLGKNISAFTGAVNQTLAQFTDMQLEISDDLNLGVRVGGFHRAEPLVMGSGYQKFVIGMACRIALANIANIPLLDGIIIDEGFSSMDNLNQDLVIDFLRDLGHEHELLFIISHLDALQAAMDRTLTIEKKISPANAAEYSFIRNTPIDTKKIDKPVEFITDPDDRSKYYCQYCKRSFASFAISKHRITKTHLKKVEDWS
jgi:DNA repair exonuclease SbcCD ATPase subunit